MRTTVTKFFALIIVLGFIKVGYSQSGYMDNALNYNKLLQNSTEEGVYKMIGSFRVIGTSYLFGNKNKGDMFSSEAKAYNISLGYNTYNQEVEFYSTSNPDQPLIKEPGSIDSFIIHSNISVGLNNPLKFIYGSHLGTNDKYYFQEVFKGEKYSLYKRYKSELGYVSTNYTQTELRQFDLTYEYYYSNSQEKGLNKLKTNANSIIKELKKIKDITPAFSYDDFTLNQDQALTKAFAYLNK